MLLCQFRETAELNDADISGSDNNSSAYRERGKANLSSIEEAWETTLLIPPPDLLPMRGQIEDSGDCSGFILSTRNVAHMGNRPRCAHPCLRAPLRNSHSGTERPQ